MAVSFFAWLTRKAVSENNPEFHSVPKIGDANFFRPSDSFFHRPNSKIVGGPASRLAIFLKLGFNDVVDRCRLICDRPLV